MKLMTQNMLWFDNGVVCLGFCRQPDFDCIADRISWNKVTLQRLKNSTKGYFKCFAADENSGESYVKLAHVSLSYFQSNFKFPQTFPDILSICWNNFCVTWVIPKKWQVTAPGAVLEFHVHPKDVLVKTSNKVTVLNSD